MSHLAVQVDSMDEAVRVLREHHVEVGEPSSPDGTAGFLTVTVKDPDGRRHRARAMAPGTRGRALRGRLEVTGLRGGQPAS